MLIGRFPRHRLGAPDLYSQTGPDRVEGAEEQLSVRRHSGIEPTQPTKFTDAGGQRLPNEIDRVGPSQLLADDGIAEYADRRANWTRSGATGPGLTPSLDPSGRPAPRSSTSIVWVTVTSLIDIADAVPVGYDDVIEEVLANSPTSR